MKRVLYIVGSNLQVNNSANLSHNALIQGILDEGYLVDVIMADNGFLSTDSGIVLPDSIQYTVYPTTSILNTSAEVFKKRIDHSEDNNTPYNRRHSLYRLIKKGIRQITKKMYYTLKNIQDGVYVNGKTWINNASGFKPSKEYDYIISNSSPASSHRVACNIIKHNHLVNSKWIQIWEDPWFYDLYGNRDIRVLKEERTLLKEADYIVYVSPLTLEYQKKYFPESAHKMTCVPLPCYNMEDTYKHHNKCSYVLGYFGDYHNYVRNVEPLYKAASESRHSLVICGSSNYELKSNEYVKVNERVNTNELSRIQSSTKVLVCVCNLKGGQIPGKIYHYSGTLHPILFILDGTEEEINKIQEYFKQYDRFYFCKNDCKSIEKMILSIETEDKEFFPVTQFAPREVVRCIFDYAKQKR